MARVSDIPLGRADEMGGARRTARCSRSWGRDPRPLRRHARKPLWPGLELGLGPGGNPDAKGIRETHDDRGRNNSTQELTIASAQCVLVSCGPVTD